MGQYNYHCHHYTGVVSHIMCQITRRTTTYRHETVGHENNTDKKTEYEELVSNLILYNLCWVDQCALLSSLGGIGEILFLN